MHCHFLLALQFLFMFLLTYVSWRHIVFPLLLFSPVSITPPVLPLSPVSVLNIHSRVSSKGVWRWCTDHTWRFDCTVCSLTIILEITRLSGNWTISGVRWKGVETYSVESDNKSYSLSLSTSVMELYVTSIEAGAFSDQIVCASQECCSPWSLLGGSY
jgi:hypothetical protein